MRRSAWLPELLSALLLAAVVPAFAATPPAASAEKQPPVPLLWKVSDKDNSLYLLGSFHMLRADDYPLSKDVDDAFADAESLLFELPPEEMLSKELGAQMAMAALRTDGTTLADDLDPALGKQLDAWTTKNAAALGKAGMTPEMLQMLEPWFVGLVVSIVEATNMGFESELGLDAHVAAKAKEANKAAGGLETGAQQLALLDGMSKDEQVQMLAESLSEGGDKGEVGALHRAWRAGDVDTLWSEMAVDVRSKYPALYKRINIERNDAWVPKLEARLAAPGTDDTLVVVGSLHLLGNDGVVEKLKKKGYKVERVCSACNGK
jgi:uncharacterized protein YbaP (TraB family)